MHYPSQICDMVRAGTNPWVPGVRIASGCLQAFLIKSTANEELGSAHVRGAAPTAVWAGQTWPQTVTWCDRHNGAGPASTEVCEERGSPGEKQSAGDHDRAQVNGWFRGAFIHTAPTVSYSNQCK